MQKRVGATWLHNFWVIFVQDKQHFPLLLPFSNTQKNSAGQFPKAPKLSSSARLGSEHSITGMAPRTAWPTAVNMPSNTRSVSEEHPLAQKVDWLKPNGRVFLRLSPAAGH